MSITDHGQWRRYIPDPAPEGWPVGVMFCRRADGKDWYDYVSNSSNFSLGTVCMMVRIDNNVVSSATYDVAGLFPQDHYVLEMSGYSGSDPHADYRLRIYNPADGTFTDPPLSTPEEEMPKAMLARIVALEKKKGPD